MILLHGYGANRTELLEHAAILARHGYGALLYDLRAHGESQGTERMLGWADVPDVIAALDYLETRPEVDGRRIGVFGFSVGGQIALRAAAEDERLRAVFVDDPGFVTARDAPPPATTSEWLTHAMNWIDVRGMQLWTWTSEPPGIVDIIGAISPRPILIISTGQGLGARLGRHYYELSGEPKELWEIPEATHGGSLSVRRQEYESKLVEFFDQALLAK